MSFNKLRGPFIIGFLNSLYKRFYFIKLYSKYGDLKDKLNIIIVVLLDLIPRRLKLGFLKKLIIKAKSKLISETIARVDGLKYFLTDFESLQIISREHEEWMWNYLKPKKGEVFIDVGAHIGKYALQVAKIVGEKGLVIAIEASPINYNVLLKIL